jgi:hypothetical protein
VSKKLRETHRNRARALDQPWKPRVRLQADPELTGHADLQAIEQQMHDDIARWYEHGLLQTKDLRDVRDAKFVLRRKARKRNRSVATG